MPDSSAEQVTLLRLECHRLKQRVFELEEELRRIRGSLREKETAHAHTTVKLLRQKDDKLSEYAAELEEKNQELLEAVQTLERKNEELQLWISSLRLYQDIFESEPVLMVGFNRDGRLVLYNRMATDLFGEAFAQNLFREVEEIGLSSLDPQIPRLVREALALAERKENQLVRDGAEVHTLVLPIRTGQRVRGALLKVTKTAKG